MSELPIAAIRAAFAEAIVRAPVVISSPTGSGKSIHSRSGWGGMRGAT